MRLQVFILFTLTHAIVKGGLITVAQPFDPNLIYTYEYVAIAENRDLASGKGSDVKINCSVTISIPRRYFGKLRVDDCRVEEGIVGSGGTVTYHEHPLSGAFEKQMAMQEMGFYFNGGQISRIIVDKLQRTNVTNFKRGILSSMQAYNPDLPKHFEDGDIFEVQQMNIYGEGIVEHRILKKSNRYPSQIEIIRDTSKIKLPWESKRWNFLRMKNYKDSPLTSALQDYITVNSDKLWTKAKQNCTYDLNGLRVISASCEERYPFQLVKPDWAQSFFKVDVVESIVRQKIRLKNVRRMNIADHTQSLKSRFRVDSIMFEEEWEDTNSLYNRGFDAEMAFLNLVKFPTNRKTPAIISRLIRWLLVTNNQSNIQAIWAKCDRECNQSEKSQGRILWVELLNSCISSDWSLIPYHSTKNATTCERALEAFLKFNIDQGLDVELANIKSLASIHAPSSKIVGIALKICRAKSKRTGKCVTTLAEVTKNYLSTCDGDCLNKKPVENVKDYLIRNLCSDCDASLPEEEQTAIAVVNAIAKLGRNGGYARDKILDCATNATTSSRLAIQAIIALGSITEDNLEETILVELISLFRNVNTPLETRITCFHLLMKKRIPWSAVRTILSTIMDENEDPALAKHCKRDIRTQLRLRRTDFCQFHDKVVDAYIQLIREKKYEIGLSTGHLHYTPVQKVHKINRELVIPYIKMKADCTIRVISVYESWSAKIPMAGKAIIDITMEGRTVRIIEAAMDMEGFKSHFDRTFGHETFYTQLFNNLLEPRVNSTSYQSLLKSIAAKGIYDHVKKFFGVKIPVVIKVLGQDVSLDKLLSIVDIHELVTGNLWKFIRRLETGIEHDASFFGQLFMMQHAAPTSIGSPMISTAELSYFFKNKMNIKANLRDIFINENAGVSFDFAPEFRVSGAISRSILTQFTKSGGTELKVRMGHKSGTSCSFDKTADGAEVTCALKEKRSELFYISVTSSLINQDGIDSSLYAAVDHPFGRPSNSHLYHKAWSDAGFSYDVVLDSQEYSEYHTSIDWRSSSDLETSETIREFAMKCTATNRANPKEKKFLWSSKVSFIPERNEIHCDIAHEQFSWKVHANALRPRVEGLMITINATGNNSTDFRHDSFLKILPRSEKGYIVEGESKWRKAAADFEGYALSGVVNESTEGLNTTRVFDMKIIDINGEPGEELFSYFTLAKKASLESMSGLESVVIIEGPILPIYRKYQFEMSTYHSELRYDESMKISVHHKNMTKNPLFFIHRITGPFLHGPNDTVRSISRDATNEIHCVCNLFHYKFSTTVKEGSRIDARGKLNLPESPIAFTNVATLSGARYYTYNYNYVAPNGTVIDWVYTKDGKNYYLKVGYRLWDAFMQKYVYEMGTMKYSGSLGCYYRHNFEIKHPKLVITSIADWSNNHEEKWIKVHYSLLSYIRLSKYIPRYLINSMENDYVEIGHRYRKLVDDQRDYNLLCEAVLLNNNIHCLADPVKKHDNPDINCDIGITAIDHYGKISFKFLENWRISSNVTWEARNSGQKIYTSFYDLDGNGLKHIIRTEYTSENWFDYIDVIETTFERVGSVIKFHGQYKSTNKILQISRIKNYNGFLRDSIYKGVIEFQVKIMCIAEPEKVCSEVAFNKSQNELLYERFVHGYKYESFSITSYRKRLVLSFDSEKSVIFNLKNLAIALELEPNFELGINTTFFNASCRYEENRVLKVSSSLTTSLAKFLMTTIVDNKQASYELDFDSSKLGGVRFTSSASVNYSVLNLAQHFSGNLLLGHSSESLGCQVAIPDLDFKFKSTTDKEEPTKYRNFLNATIAPYNITINKMKLHLVDQEIEITGTALACEFDNGRIASVSVRNIDYNVLPKYSGTNPLVIKGDAMINTKQIKIDIFDHDKTFVCKVSFDAAIPLTHHAELVLNTMITKTELLWDLNSDSDGIEMTGKCKISEMSWKTRKLSPLISVDIHGGLVATSNTRNFPEISLKNEFLHAFQVPYIPTKVSLSLSTIYDGDVTNLIYFASINKSNLSEIAVTLTGCHKRLEISPSLKVCIPNALHSRIIHDIPAVIVFVNTIDIKRDPNNGWVVSYNQGITFPIVGPDSVRTDFILNTKCRSRHIAPEWGIRIPDTFHLRNLRLVIPPAYEKLVLGIVFSSDSYRFNGITLENSDLFATYNVISGVTTIKTAANISQEGRDGQLLATTTHLFMHRRLVSNISVIFGKDNLHHLLDVHYDSEARGWNYNHSLDCPWVHTKVTVGPTGRTSPACYNMSLEMPNGPIRKIMVIYASGKFYSEAKMNIAGDIGTAKQSYLWDAPTEIWNIQNTVKHPLVSLDNNMNVSGMRIIACDFNITAAGIVHDIRLNLNNDRSQWFCNVGTVKSKIEKTGNQFISDFKWGSSPWADQSFIVVYNNDGEDVDYETTHSTKYHTCITKFTSNGYQVKGKLLDWRMKNSEAGLKIEYVKEKSDHICIITVEASDDTKIFCRTTPLVEGISAAHLSCNKIEGAKNENFVNIAVEKKDFPFMDEKTIEDEVLFVSRFSDALLKSLSFDEAKLGAYIQSVFKCSQKEICYGIAKRIKSMHYAFIREVERFAGPKSIYVTNSIMMESAIHDTISLIPGSFMIIPAWNEWKENSITDNIKKMIDGRKFSMMHWSFHPYFHIATGLKIVDKNDLRLVVECESNTTFFEWSFAALLGLERGEIYPVVTKHCETGCKTGLVMKYNWKILDEGKHNITVLLVNNSKVSMACDVVAFSNLWSNAEVECYEDKSYIYSIGKLSISTLMSFNVDESTSTDSILREVFQIRSPSYRKKITSQLNNFLSQINHFSKYPNFVIYAIQSALASEFHEIATDSNIHDFHDIFERFYLHFLGLGPQMQAIYAEVTNLFGGNISNNGIVEVLKKLLAPVFDSLRYMLDGHVNTEYKIKDGDILIRNVLSSVRYPHLNMDTLFTISRPSLKAMLFKIGCTTKFAEMDIDAHLYEADFRLDKVRFSLPERIEEFIEIRILPNPESKKSFTLEMLIVAAKYQQYGCRGVSESYASSYIHMHCFKIEGTKFPANTPFSKMVAFWDVNVEKILFSPFQATVALLKTFIKLKSNVNACSKDPDFVDKALLEVYHVYDYETRERMMRKITEICRKWVDVFIRGSRDNKYSTNFIGKFPEAGIATLTRKLKSYSYDKLKNAMLENIFIASMKISDHPFSRGAATIGFAYAAPLAHYAATVFEFINPVGVFKVSNCVTCKDRMEYLEIYSEMESSKLLILDHTVAVQVTSNGIFNASIANKCAWAWLACDMENLVLKPRRAKFGIARSYKDGIEFLFFPADVFGGGPDTSVSFDVDHKYICDVTVKSSYMANITCNDFESRRRGIMAANCTLNEYNFLIGAGLLAEATIDAKSKLRRILREMEKVCVISNPAFKTSVSSSLAVNLDYAAQCSRNMIRESLKTGADLLNQPWSDISKFAIDFRVWVTEFSGAVHSIKLWEFWRSVRGEILLFFKWCQDIVSATYSGVEVFYGVGYTVNGFFYELLA